MRCSHCGKCCTETEMLLSEADIEKLEKANYGKAQFVRYDKQGHAILRNRRRHCVFYDLERQRCGIYKYRPSGCRIYPVVFSEERGITVDRLCPMGSSVSKNEMRKRGMQVGALLTRIDLEARSRFPPRGSKPLF